jgi:DNA-binding response OmpR family regulator
MALSCILIVEGDVLVRSPLAEFLRDCGFRVLEAAGAGEARRLLAEGAQSIDAVLADADAPGAFALARWIRSGFPAIRLIMAGSPATAAAKAGELCEDGPLLAKPYDHQLVLDHIRRLLATRDESGEKS